MLMAEARSKPYVYVTWLTKLLAGEDHCAWKAWFKAHNRYDKQPSDFNLAKWILDHTEMLTSRADSLRSEGYEVWIENQNEFKFVGKAGTMLAGKPDIVAV